MGDRLVTTALQEISTEGLEGCPLPRLWSLLQDCGIQLDAYVRQAVWQGLLNVPGMTFRCSAQVSVDPSSIRALKDAETRGVSIVASQDLRDACLGLYDIRHADTQPSQIQQSILQESAKARSTGVAQNQLGKDFKVEGNKLFYILKSLESRGLVVRRPTLVRSGRSSGSTVQTNLVFLSRYGKHLCLNQHQQLEVSGQQQLMINDDLPAMKAVCDRLEQAEGKILVVSDLKLALGYSKPAGHRAWRRLLKIMTESGLVNVMDAKIGQKVKPCIKLLKAFSELQTDSPSDAGNNEVEMKGPKRGQVTEQLVELSVDQQVYEMIDEQGSDGLMMMEVWKRLGLNNKRNYYRVQNMTIRHGVLMEAENHKRSTLYRLRTSNSKKGPPEPELDDMETPWEARNETEATSTGMTLSTRPESLPAAMFRAGQPYPCLAVTTTSIQREARILDRLQEERFIVRPQLHRWLESISDRTSTMDRKTLGRTLIKLEKEGKLKTYLFGMPARSCGRERSVEIVALPLVEVNEILVDVHDRIKKFDGEVRRRGARREAPSSDIVPVLEMVTRVNGKCQAANISKVGVQENGSVPAKMTRVRMLHSFLWDFTNSSPEQYRPADGHGYRVFRLMLALQAMPIDVFLQVVGSNRVIQDLAEHCKRGLRICDLPEADQTVLLEKGAGGKVAWLIDIMRRLKLVRIVAGHGGIGDMFMTQVSLTYAMEECIHIEQPAFQPFTKEICDFSPSERLEFSINTKDSLDEYWQTLEYFFSAAEHSSARHVFPGSCVPELFGLRSWTSLNAMGTSQRKELTRRLAEGGRKSIRDCVNIASDLHLTLEQVLRASHVQNRGSRMTPPEQQKSLTTQIQTEGETRQGSAITSSQDHQEGDDSNNLSSMAFTGLKPSRSRRFAWSDELDRYLVFAYARQRALFGAAVNRVDWNRVQSLPAHPEVCRRRLSALKSVASAKKAILNLCSLLAAQYGKYCHYLENMEEGHEFGADEQPEVHWDNPDDPCVAAAIDEIMRCKSLVRPCYSNPKSSSDRTKRPGADLASSCSKRAKMTMSEPLQSQGGDVHLSPSVGVSNAIEFIKLVFLNLPENKDDVQLPEEFIRALQQFKQSDVMAAFNYLRGCNVVVEQGQSFNLSRSFTRNISGSKLRNASEEALAAMKWLQEHKAELESDWVTCTMECHYGQLLHLFTKVELGELSISPQVPDLGGESEDPRTMACGLKRKAQDQQASARTVKPRLDGVYCDVRREKGFPGIQVLLKQQFRSMLDVLTEEMEPMEEDSCCMCPSSSPEPSPSTPLSEHSSPLLDAALGYIEHAGDQGLSLPQLAEAMSLPATDLEPVEKLTEALESAGRVRLVNAFDHVRVLAQAHAAPYLMTHSEEPGNGDASTFPIVPWLAPDGTVNTKVFKGLAKHVLGLVMLNPGITEERIIEQVQELNPQTARQLLHLLELDGMLLQRKVAYPRASPPSLLQGVFQGSEDYVQQQIHYSVNPTSLHLVQR